MFKILRSKFSLKFIVIIILIALVVTAVFLITSSGEGRNLLTVTIEGGESTLVAVGRCHESIINFVNDNEETASEKLSTAKQAQEYAKIRLEAVKDTSDDFVLKLSENYETILDSSYVMAQGIDNLLIINTDLKEALNYYQQGEYAAAAQEASSCLEILTPLVDQFILENQSLNTVNYYYLPSGHKENVGTAVFQYKNEMQIYFGYVSLLESIVNGVDYLNEMGEINELLNQLQHALANNDYSDAERLVQEISDKLNRLKRPEYQAAAEKASELNPALFEGEVYLTARDLRMQLKNLEALEGYEKYLDSLDKYIEALIHLEENESEEADEAVTQGLAYLDEGEYMADEELQKHYTALRSAFMQLRNPPSSG